jgi:hypothetical protein
MWPSETSERSGSVDVASNDFGMKNSCPLNNDLTLPVYPVPIRGGSIHFNRYRKQELVEVPTRQGAGGKPWTEKGALT